MRKCFKRKPGVDDSLEEWVRSRRDVEVSGGVQLCRSHDFSLSNAKRRAIVSAAKLR